MRSSVVHHHETSLAGCVRSAESSGSTAIQRAGRDWNLNLVRQLGFGLVHRVPTVWTYRLSTGERTVGWWVERFGITSSTAATTRRLVLRVKAHTAGILSPSFRFYVSQLRGVNTALCSRRVFRCETFDSQTGKSRLSGLEPCCCSESRIEIRLATVIPLP